MSINVSQEAEEPVGDLHQRVASGSLLRDVRSILEQASGERLLWIRTNTSLAMEAQSHVVLDICAMTGLSAGTVKGFLRATDSSIKNVLLIAMSLGLNLADLERPPEEFREWLKEKLAEETSGTGAA